jgi:nucleosome binding factor SPN SPT16 subunit
MLSIVPSYHLLQVDFQSVEFVYVPQIQSSASGYTLKLLNEPSPTNIAFKGVIITAIGLKYKAYCANVSRTYIVDPTRSQEEVYGLVEILHKEVVSRMKEGAVAKDIYNHALGIVRQKKPELEGHFIKSLGHAVSTTTTTASLIVIEPLVDGLRIQGICIRYFCEELARPSLEYGVQCIYRLPRCPRNR